MYSGEISKLIEWLRNNNHSESDILECIEFVTSKSNTLEEFKDSKNK